MGGAVVAGVVNKKLKILRVVEKAWDLIISSLSAMEDPMGG
jgi:hypothetical protein